MNYRHIYHAGNFADVFKHWILTLLLAKLTEKTTPFCIVDTHAGLGQYDLNNPNSQKTLEYSSGIEKIMTQIPGPAFTDYYKIIADNYKNNIYPGSPKIIQSFLRQNDRAFLSELHPEDYKVLCANFNNDKRIKIFNQDAYQTVRAVLPPLEKRGLVLIDPPFEQTDEFKQIIKALQQGLKRFAHGMYAIWYPIKDHDLVEEFYRDLASLKLEKVLRIEIHANTQILNGLNSCGMVIINPPWQLEQQLEDNMPKLLEYLAFESGSYSIT